MHRIGRRGDEIEFEVEASRLVVFRMLRECAYPCNIGRLERAQHRIFQQRLTDTFALPAVIDSETRQQHDGNGMARESFGQALRRFLARHMAYREGVRDRGEKDPDK
jgi:hypothetical protein